ncbi:chromosomal replication initiator DnaA [Aliiruegeria sabulilitoris]|uniref:chromosomal replication initiator DnaA n=1 Tax=Aliiruegeria sabulilitoris TaxID=1510458 RepID=UPI00082CAF4C|nr:chromosomal replication initiator DnaA [Aliiruegeria sabulilitoris]NDR56028.1 chromosomal replication initiator DnaA [Pseudoruegeria sp. M32A2M]
MSEQLNLDLPVRSATGREDFFLSPGNALAVAEIDRWRDWQAGKLALIGPEGSGKTHLTHVWASDAGAEILSAREVVGWQPKPGNFAIEDVPEIVGDAEAERALFHLHNFVLAEGGRLLVSGIEPPALWQIELPDLASRMRGTPSARLEPPDDPLLQALLYKLFNDRQITPQPSLVPWLLKRMDRSFAEAGRIVAALDSRALATGRPIGPKLAAELLEEDTDRG